MEHIYGFNEEFNWNKLNIFSKKEKEKFEEQDYDDDDLANAIYKKVALQSDHLEISGSFGDRDGLTGERVWGMLKFEFDGDNFTIYPNGISINGSSLKCKESIRKKFWNKFTSAKKSQDDNIKNSKDKEVKDKLKSKYN